MVKKFVCICLLCVYVCATTEVYQLFKLPAFYQHLQEHRQQNTGITFFDYLTLHYAGNGTDTDNDAADDNRLPFKQHELPVMGNWSPAPLPAFYGLLNLFCGQQSILLGQYQLQFRSSGYIHLVWQPPKMV